MPANIDSWHGKNDKAGGFNNNMVTWGVAVASITWAAQRPRIQNNNGPANYSIHRLVNECIRLFPDFVLSHYRLGDEQPINFKPSDFGCFFPNCSVYTELAWNNAQPLWQYIGMDSRRQWFSNCNPVNPTIAHFICFCLDPHVLNYQPGWYHHATDLLRQFASGLSSNFESLQTLSGLDEFRSKRLKTNRHVVFQLMIDCKNRLMLPRGDEDKVRFGKKKHYCYYMAKTCLWVLPCKALASRWNPLRYFRPLSLVS